MTNPEEHGLAGTRHGIFDDRFFGGAEVAQHMLHGIAFRFVKLYVKDLHLQPITSVVHLRTIKIAQH